jgi:PleD family two-component response regulator
VNWRVIVRFAPPKSVASFVLDDGRAKGEPERPGNERSVGMETCAEVGHRRQKILLVDDSSTVLLTERTILTRTRYEVVTARDGQEGVEKLELLSKVENWLGG